MLRKLKIWIVSLISDQSDSDRSEIQAHNSKCWILLLFLMDFDRLHQQNRLHCSNFMQNGKKIQEFELWVWFRTSLNQTGAKYRLTVQSADFAHCCVWISTNAIYSFDLVKRVKMLFSVVLHGRCLTNLSREKCRTKILEWPSPVRCQVPSPLIVL